MPASVAEAKKLRSHLDPWLPPPGVGLERVYGGNLVAMKVRIDGFEFET